MRIRHARFTGIPKIPILNLVCRYDFSVIPVFSVYRGYISHSMVLLVPARGNMIIERISKLSRLRVKRLYFDIGKFVESLVMYQVSIYMFNILEFFVFLWIRYNATLHKAKNPIQNTTNLNL